MEIVLFKEQKIVMMGILYLEMDAIVVVALRQVIHVLAPHQFAQQSAEMEYL